MYLCNKYVNACNIFHVPMHIPYVCIDRLAEHEYIYIILIHMFHVHIVSCIPYILYINTISSIYVCTYNMYTFSLPCTTFHALSLWPVPTVVIVACSWSRFSGTKPKTGFHHALKLPLMRAALEMHLRILSTSLSACVPSPDLPLPPLYLQTYLTSVCLHVFALKTYTLSVSLPLPLCCLSVTLTISPHSYSPHSCTHSVSLVPLPLLP